MKPVQSIAICCCFCAAVVLAFGCEETTVQGPGGRSLTLKKPAGVTLEQGKSVEVMVNIARVKVAEPISVTFSKLPDGVSVMNADKAIVGDEGKFLLEAAASAALVENHVAEVTVKGPDGIQATEMLTITVKEAAAPSTVKPPTEGTKPPPDEGTKPTDEGTKPPPDEGAKPPSDEGAKPPAEGENPSR